jgi:hypothetical protein
MPLMPLPSCCSAPPPTPTWRRALLTHPPHPRPTPDAGAGAQPPPGAVRHHPAGGAGAGAGGAERVGPAGGLAPPLGPLARPVRELAAGARRAGARAGAQAGRRRHRRLLLPAGALCVCLGGGKEGEGAQRGLWPVACGPGAAAVAAGAGLAATQPRPPPPPPPPPQDPSGANVAVFKPEDEEPLAINNPKGLGTSPNGEGLRRGTRPGEGAVREVRPRLPACLLALPCPAPRKPRFPPTCSGAAETRTACLEPS